MADKPSFSPYVEELQQYLRTISKAEPSIPLLVPDGIFGPETSAAVRAFQMNEGLGATGTVDLVTWTAIFGEYERVVRREAPAVSINPFRDDEHDMIQPGQEGVQVLFAQAILIKLAEVYVNLNSGVEPSGKLDAPTVTALKEVQAVADMKRRDGALDKETWDALARLHEMNV